MRRVVVAVAMLTGGCGSGVSSGSFEEPVGLACILGWGLVLPLSAFAGIAWKALGLRRLARQADGQVGEHTALREGPAVLNGRVAAEDPGGAVRVEITQDGSEGQDNSGNWSFKWEEKDRRILARPFVLELPSNERVLVEPDERKVWLVDALDGVVRIDRTRRKLTAELTPGEPVICVGRLVNRPVGAGYRSAEARWVLVPPKARNEPMVLSTEPLGERFARKVRGAAATVGVGLGLLALLHAAAVGYHLRRWVGQTVRCEVVAQRAWTTTDDDGHPVAHRAATVRLPDGRLFEEELNASDLLGPSVAVQWVRYPSWATTFGRTPTAHFALVGLAFAIPWLIAMFYAAVSRKAWYEGRRMTQTGSGRLS